MRVAINGIGVAGPTLAYWLRESGHEPVLFEHAPSLRTGGYLIDFWGLGYEIADRMGLVPTLRERCYEMARVLMVDRDGRERAAMDVGRMRERLQGRFISVARGDLAAALFRACDGIPAHFGVSVEAMEQDGEGVLVDTFRWTTGPLRPCRRGRRSTFARTHDRLRSGRRSSNDFSIAMLRRFVSPAIRIAMS